MQWPPATHLIGLPVVPSARFVALVPPQSADHLKRTLRGNSIEFVRDTCHLRQFLATDSFEAALIDPSASGCSIQDLSAVMAAFPRPLYIAYVGFFPQGIRAVFELSKYGLADVFLHPMKFNDSRFASLSRSLPGAQLAADLAAAIEPKLKMLPPTINAAVEDLFRRPRCYRSANDLAQKAGISCRSLHRALERAAFTTPRTLIAAAKVIHGYTLLRDARMTVRKVSTYVGYSSPESFSRNIREHFCIHPKEVARLIPADALLALIESLSKPQHCQ